MQPTIQLPRLMRRCLHKLNKFVGFAVAVLFFTPVSKKSRERTRQPGQGLPFARFGLR